ncbi:MAG TPA: hypothetical protein VE398_20450 [Acidobacteriota bacterium]|nr:hypothetical protein [Acidobacteriota bacterium]
MDNYFIEKHCHRTPIRILLAAGIAFGVAKGGVAADLKLEDALAHASTSVEAFWKQFPSVTCTESVTQDKLGKSGKVEYEQKSIFDYLIFMNLEGNSLTVEESRLLQKSIGKSKNLPLLISSGFPTLLLVFHPFYQGNFRYQLDGEETANGKNLLRIQFEHISGTRSTSALRLRGRDYPLDLKGTAWVNRETGKIQKIVAGLEAPMDDLNLKVLNVEVRYEPHQFQSSSEVEWLPSTAIIDVETARQRWHNVHSFSNYKRFSVNSESTVGK